MFLKTYFHLVLPDINNQLLKLFVIIWLDDCLRFWQLISSAVDWSSLWTPVITLLFKFIRLLIQPHKWGHFLAVNLIDHTEAIQVFVLNGGTVKCLIKELEVT